MEPGEALEASTSKEDSVPLVQAKAQSNHRPVLRWQLPLLPFFVLHDWLSRLSEAFGSRFVLAVIIVYGISQGVGETVGGFSSNYFWKDVMKVSPAASQVGVVSKAAQRSASLVKLGECMTVTDLL